MKTITLRFTFTALLAIPGLALAQNTFPANGNVAIGTTNPLVALHVVSGVTSPYQGNMALYDNSAVAAGIGGQINFGGKYSTTEPEPFTDWASIQGTKANATSGHVGGRLEFRTRQHGPFMTTKMVLDDLGNLGIGTTNPTAKLNVMVSSGNTTVSSEIGALQIGNADGTPNNLDGILFKESHGNPVAGIFGVNVYHSAASISVEGNLIFTTKQALTGVINPEERMRIDSTGRVGIGTTSPEEKLEVFGGIMSQGPTPGFSRFILKSTAAGGQQYEWYNDASGPGSGILALYNRTGDNRPIAFTSSGNVGIGTLTPQAKLDVNGKINCTVLELTSDRNAKAGFAAVDNRELLQKVTRLPLSTWHYTNAPGVRHLGPMAQDFQAAFHLGTDDKHIATVDADGVALAAIQGLYELLQEKDARIAALEQKLAQMDSLTARIAAVEKMFARANPVSADSARAQKSSNPGFSSALQGSEGAVP